MKLIRFATLAPEGSAWMVTMHELDAELREKSGGEVGFKFYPNMSMGDETDVIRKIRLGQINGAGFTGFGLGEILTEMRILELPYLYSDDDELDYVKEQLIGYFEEKLAEKGFILLGWADVGWIYFLSQEPVAEPIDLKGLKVWMWEGDPLAKAFFAELKKSPVPLSVTDVHLSLQTGLIDAVYCSPLAALLLQWFTKVEYISDIPFTNSIGAVLLDKRTYDDLSPEIQIIVRETSRKHLRELVIKSRKDNSEAYLHLLKEGLKQVKSTQEQRDKMANISLKVHSRLSGKLYSPELLTRLKEILADYRSSGEE
ncbi:MAG: TRAP transporter substrate-binding protein DctP [Candidatus Hatepunaea meridiana]|nr:TRAP transporter substrate-binding protein DctP [Candidatus Hatepunaea meridiana]